VTKNKLKLASRISRLKASPIRDILKVLERPEMISFAGGLPAVETFPDFANFNSLKQTLQYGPTEGDEPLRQLIAERLADQNLHISPQQVLVLSGSQQGIDLVAKLMIDSGTVVAVENPTYLAALQVFNLFGAAFEPFSVAQLDNLAADDHPPGMLYVNPTFHNPTGYCYTESERQRLAKICVDKGKVLFEDDPYRDLAYSETCRTPICSYAEGDRWIYQSSFSKTFAPGLRLGYLVCSEQLLPYLARLKQAADLHSNRLSQQLVYQQLTDPANERRLHKLVETYRIKRELFNHYLERHLSDVAEWEAPDGGLFFWLRLKSEYPIDTRELLAHTLDLNVAFMPGEAFFANNEAAVGQLRLNFSLTNERQMAHGLATLGTAIRSFSKRNAEVA